MSPDNKKPILFSTVLFFLISSVVIFQTLGQSKNNSIEKVYSRNIIQDQARILVKEGRFDEALIKYKEAAQPHMVNYEYDKAVAMGAMREIYKWQEKYDEALKVLDWFFENSATGKPTKSALEEKKEIQALIDFKKTKNKLSVLEYVNYLKNEYKDDLPPVAYNSVSTISTLLRLYDTIGDHGAGIKFIDEILDFLRQRRKAKGDSSHVLYDLKTSKKATECMNRPRPNPDFNGCRFMREYLLIREAFEKDKAEGTKGRATKALIQSDYFPW